MSECCLLYSLLHSMSVSERLVYLNVCLMKFFELIFNFPNFLTKVQLGIFLMFCFRDWCLSLFCSQSSLTCIPNHQGNVSWFCVVCCDVPRPLVSVHCPLFFLSFSSLSACLSPPVCRHGFSSVPPPLYLTCPPPSSVSCTEAFVPHSSVCSLLLLV